MIRIAIIYLLIVVFATPGIAQATGYKDSIELVKNPLGALKFYQQDKKLTMGQVSGIMRPNAEAFKYINKASTNNTLAFITGFIGGLFIGYEIGNAIRGNDINWGVMGAGAGFIVISIPFDIGATRNARKAVYLYNSAFR